MSLKVWFGEKLKKYRTDLGMTREAFAEKIDMHPSNLARIEAGIQFPKPETLDNLVAFLGISYSELFDFSKDKFSEKDSQNIQEVFNKYIKRLSEKDLKFFAETIKLYIKSR